jgi:hypothetical protein
MIFDTVQVIFPVAPVVVTVVGIPAGMVTGLAVTVIVPVATVPPSGIVTVKLPACVTVTVLDPTAK